MQMLDANIILRYLLNDNKTMADEAEKIINEGSVQVTLEVIAEHNLDFVDCILYAYNRAKGYEIKTFDKKLKSLLETL